LAQIVELLRRIHRVHLLLFAKSAVSIPVSIMLFGAPLAFVGEFQAHGSDVSLVRANTIRCGFSTREKRFEYRFA
jgi:hypothetical protein